MTSKKDLSVLKQKSIRKKLALAKTYLSSAKNSLKAGDFRLAADAAYNGLELAMKAALLLKTDKLPKRHGGVAQLFSLLYVKEKILDASYGKKIGRAFALRNKARYDEEAVVIQADARENISLAEDVVDFIDKIVRE